MKVKRVNKKRVIAKYKKLKKLMIFEAGLIIVIGGYALKKEDYFKENKNIIKHESIEKISTNLDKIFSLLDIDISKDDPNIFNINDLAIGYVYNEEIDEKEVYILEHESGYDKFLTDYNNTFKAWYDLHAVDDVHRYACRTYRHVYEGDLFDLINYLTEEEINIISKNNGKISKKELDIIQNRLREEYEKNKTLKLVK